MPTKTWQWVVVAIVAIIIIALLASPQFITNGNKAVTVTDPTSLPGMQTGPAPWIAEITGLRARLTAIGLPALSSEGSVLHIHQHLDIVIDGQAVVVPAGIGINGRAGFISPLHIHDATGVIHVESPTVQTFTLGQLFDIWGVTLSADCIGGYCSEGEKLLRVYVDGVLYDGDPRTLALAPHQEIVITYGTEASLPSPIPSSYAFPPGS